MAILLLATGILFAQQGGQAEAGKNYILMKSITVRHNYSEKLYQIIRQTSMHGSGL